MPDLRYIGSTSSAAETFYKRIHQRHRTGSETTSHYFSRMYNTGRMWRLRNDPKTKADGDIAKKLRNAFVAEHCKAVWVPLPDELDIARLEAQIIALAPKEAIAWNRRGMQPYEEPTDLVDLVIDRLGFSTAERAALDRQKMRFLGGDRPSAVHAAPAKQRMPEFPRGPFRFVALDVETANHDRASICQIGVACVRPDNAIETWVTYIDPRTLHWAFTGLHGISKSTVEGAPVFFDVLPLLEDVLRGLTVYQHSGFDRSAIRAACTKTDRPEPSWDWKDSVAVARQAWPELRDAGGHGLASLKRHLGLVFDHHDAGEDARAAAEIVLRAERRSCEPVRLPDSDFDVFDDDEETSAEQIGTVQVSPSKKVPAQGQTTFGSTFLITLTPGNIRNHHFYLREALTAFPADSIGGSNAASAARRCISIDWGGGTPVQTDIDGQKKLFRNRGWVRTFFKNATAAPGDQVKIDLIGEYSCRVSVVQST